MDRRACITTVGGSILAAPLAAGAQKTVVTIGILVFEASPQIDSFRQGLKELGYVEGKNITFVASVRELVTLKPIGCRATDAEACAQTGIDPLSSPPWPKCESATSDVLEAAGS